MRYGMSKRVKISIAMVAVLLLIIGGVIALVFFLNDKGKELEEIDLTSKLSAPKNLVIDDNWILSFDRVDRAIGYQIRVDGRDADIIQVNSIDVSKYATLGLHTFAVRAMHNLASYHSAYSDTVSKAKTMVLDTPSDVIMSGTLFSWGRVTEAKSYELMIVDDLGNITTDYSSTNEYSLASFLEQNPDVSHFTISVRATATDRATGETSEYIFPSEYSEERVYHRANTVDVPVITKSFDDVVSVDDTKSISWTVDKFVQTYQIWFDGRNIKEIQYEEFADFDTYTFNLSTLLVANSLGDHSVYIVAVPRSEDVSQVVTQRSNTLAYQVRSKLDAVNAQDIFVGKEGNNLVVTWQNIAGAGLYNVELRGRTSIQDEFKLFETRNNIDSDRVTFDLEAISTSYQDVQARVQACSNSTYVDNSDWSEWSEPYSTITKLATVALQVNEGQEVIDISWDANVNSDNIRAVGSYILRVYEEILIHTIIPLFL